MSLQIHSIVQNNIKEPSIVSLKHKRSMDASKRASLDCRLAIAKSGSQDNHPTAKNNFKLQNVVELAFKKVDRAHQRYRQQKASWCASNEFGAAQNEQARGHKAHAKPIDDDNIDLSLNNKIVDKRVTDGVKCQVLDEQKALLFIGSNTMHI